MRGDATNARAHREAHLHCVVERRLVGHPAERAMVVLLPHALQRRVGVEDAPAARAEDVPGHLEEAQPRRMQKRRDHLLLVQAAVGREADGVDARELLVGAIPHKILDRADGFGVGRATQGFEESIGILHARSITHSPPCRTEANHCALARVAAQSARAGPMTGPSGFFRVLETSFLAVETRTGWKWRMPVRSSVGLETPIADPQADRGLDCPRLPRRKQCAEHSVKPAGRTQP